MPRKKLLNSQRKKKRVDSFDYSRAKKSLSKYGWKLPIKTSKQKKKLKELYKSKAGYLKYTKENRIVSPTIGERKRPKGKKGRIKTSKVSKLEYRFKFQKLGKKRLKIAKDSGVFSSNQFTPLGVFVEHNAKIKSKDFKVSFRANGEVRVTSDCRHDEIIKLDPAKLAIDPEKAVEEAIANRKCRDSRGNLRKPKTYSLMVNGFRAQNNAQLTLKQFFFYLNGKDNATNLMQRWADQHGESNDEEFADVFHVRLIY